MWNEKYSSPCIWSFIVLGCDVTGWKCETTASPLRPRFWPSDLVPFRFDVLKCTLLGKTSVPNSVPWRCLVLAQHRCRTFFNVSILENKRVWNTRGLLRVRVRITSAPQDNICMTCLKSFQNHCFQRTKRANRFQQVMGKVKGDVIQSFLGSVIIHSLHCTHTRVVQ